MSTQTEAERLADGNEKGAAAWVEGSDAYKFRMDTAAELRRLEAVNKELREALAKLAEQPAPAEGTLTELLNNPEEHYPGNFDTPQRANALLTGLCQDAATEIERLQDEVLEQCRINGMSADREDALRAEVERLNKAAHNIKGNT